MSLVNELQDLAEPADLDCTAGAAAVGSEAAAGELSEDDAAPAKRFKKSAPEAPALSTTALSTTTPSLSTTAPADASCWDFEKDLENIFTTQARKGEKPLAKTKSKGAQ